MKTVLAAIKRFFVRRSLTRISAELTVARLELERAECDYGALYPTDYTIEQLLALRVRVKDLQEDLGYVQSKMSTLE